MLLMTILLATRGAAQTGTEAPAHPDLSRLGSFRGVTADEIARAVYPKWDRASGRTGESLTWRGASGPRLARLVQARAWKGEGREELVAAFMLWVGRWDTWAQASGPMPCDVALLERDGKSLTIRARGFVPKGCSAKLDLAAYKMDPRATLIGVRELWVNHGNEDTRLSLLKVEPPDLKVVLEDDIAHNDVEGIVTMVPAASGPADIRITKKGTDDAGHPVDESGFWTWKGTRYERAEKK